MSNFIVVMPNGLIREAGKAQRGTLDLVDVPPGHQLVETEHPVLPREHYYDGTLKKLPSSPGPWAVFDVPSETWTDPRDDAVVQQERQIALHRLTVEAGQELSRIDPAYDYRDKLHARQLDEARSFLASSASEALPTSFPLLSVKAQQAGLSAYQMAQVWLFKGHQSMSVTAEIEAIRDRAKQQIKSAVSGQEIHSSLETATTAFRAIEQ